jgi:hypothetical protein
VLYSTAGVFERASNFAGTYLGIFLEIQTRVVGIF